MRKRALWLVGALIAGVSLVASGATAGTSPSAAKIRKGGSVIFGADQEPRHLNDFIEGGDHLWAVIPHYLVNGGAYTITPKFTYQKDMISSAKFGRVGKKGMYVLYHISPKARWSDGKPVTAQDFKFEWQTIMNPKYKDVILSTVGYEFIRSAKIINPKTIRFNFSEIYADWRDLFGEPLPYHALKGLDFTNVWKSDIDNPKTGKPLGSGPYLLTKWNKGCCMIFTKNPKYYKAGQPYLNKITFRFVEDTNTQIQQIRGGELTILNPQPQLTFTALKKVKSLRVQTFRGPSWEKLDFNLGYGKGPYNPLLKKKFVRQAIAHAINRESIVKTLLRPIAPGLPVLNSAIIVTNSKYYKPYWKQYNYSPAKARQIMTKNGCRRGGDGIFTCQGQKASFHWTGTTGNQRRELTFEIVQAQLKAAGIQVVADFSPPSITFGRRLPQGDYDIADFAYSSSTPSISAWDNVFACRSEAKGIGLQNRQGYCNKKVTKYLRAVNKELNNTKQYALTNKALSLMAKDLVDLPLYQLPSMLVFRKNVHNLVDNTLSSGPFWNVGKWWVSKS